MGRARVEQEMTFLNSAEKEVREEIFTTLKSTETSYLVMSLIALGQIGNPEDGPRIAPYLLSNKNKIRRTAGVALSRLGDASLPIFEKLLKTASPQTRRLVIASLPMALTSKARSLLLMGFADSDADVRHDSLTVLNNLPPVLESQRPALIKEAQRQLKNESNQDVLLALQLLGK